MTIGIDKAVGHDVTAFYRPGSKPKTLTLSLKRKYKEVSMPCGGKKTGGKKPPKK